MSHFECQQAINLINDYDAQDLSICLINFDHSYYYRKATKVQSCKILQALLDKNKDIINSKNDSGYTALMTFSGRLNKLERVEVLLKNDANMEACDGVAGMTALMIAASYGNIAIAKALLFKGAKKETKNKDGCKALMIAASYGNLEMVKLLLTNGANINADHEAVLGWFRKSSEISCSVLSLAINSGNLKLVKFLLDSKVNLAGAVEKRYFPSLITAVYNDFLEKVKVC